MSGQGIEELLARARARLDRVSARDAWREVRSGTAWLVDIRPAGQRAAEGEVAPGLAPHVIERNVLEWRLDPRCEHRNQNLARPGARVILVCDEGYQSSLAAATVRRFGIDATDVIGGFQAWLADGLPVERPVA